MPEANGTHYEFYPGAPKYFKRMYDTGDAPFEQVKGSFAVFTPEFHGLKIYGFSLLSQFTEDHDYQKRSFKSGYFMSYCFSEVVPDGEMGSTPLNEVEEITEEEFNAAKERGWL